MDLHRCPACSAALRPDAQWCSLCYLDLRVPEPSPAPAAPPMTAAPPSAGPAPVDPATAAASTAPTTTATLTSNSGGPGEPAGWPCTTCSAVVPIDLDVCTSCGASFLGRLAGDSGRHRSIGGGSGLSRLPRPARLGVGLVLGVLFAVLVPLLLALLG